MRVIALLSWFDEPGDWLVDAVSSLARVCDHVVAVDGAYEAFPHDTPFSAPAQAEAILRACAWYDLGCTLQTSRAAWPSEVAKRDAVLQMGLSVADTGDWFLVIDADEMVERIPDDVRDVLAATAMDVAEVWLQEPGGVDRALRRLFCAQPHMQVVGGHQFVNAGGRLLASDGSVANPTVPALALHSLVLEHRADQRSPGREARKARYYRDRDRTSAERYVHRP